MFDSHKYGSLYFDGKDHGIEFFAFIRTDSYDSVIFAPNVEEGQREKYLEGLFAKAVHVREAGVSRDDRLVLLSTCSSSATNGRDILVGRVTDVVYDDPFVNTIISDDKAISGQDGPFRYVKEPSAMILATAVILAALIVVYILAACHKSKQHKQETEAKTNDNNTKDAREKVTARCSDHGTADTDVANGCVCDPGSGRDNGKSGLYRR